MWCACLWCGRGERVDGGGGQLAHAKTATAWVGGPGTSSSIGQQEWGQRQWSCGNSGAEGAAEIGSQPTATVGTGDREPAAADTGRKGKPAAEFDSHSQHTRRWLAAAGLAELGG